METINFEIVALLLNELTEEAKTTRKMLARVPAEKFDWQPHPKSMSLMRLAVHLAELPGWVAMTMNTDELDFENNPYEHKKVGSTGELLDFFENCLAEGKAALENADEEILNKEWVLRSGEIIHSRRTKYDVLRMSISQTIHHRAQLGVYLRLLDLPIPGSYGPSADEITF